MKWFPQIKDMINIERLCLAVGFNKEQTATLLTGKPIEYNGELYSEEHNLTTASDYRSFFITFAFGLGSPSPRQERNVVLIL